MPVNWVFKDGGSETTRIMNLVNLPMLKSSAVRKLTSTSKPATATKATHESLKKQTKSQFAKTLGWAVDEDPNGEEASGKVGGKNKDEDAGGKQKQKKQQPLDLTTYVYVLHHCPLMSLMSCRYRLRCLPAGFAGIMTLGSCASRMWCIPPTAVNPGH